MTDLVFQEDAYARDCAARVVAAEGAGITLDRTVFYPMGGGQAGDTGVLRMKDGTEIAIADTRKGENGEVLHIPHEDAPLPAPGAAVTAEIDWPRRHRLMRMHSCLHLLCAAVPGAVTGGSVGDGKGRLDFDLPETTLDKQAITETLNRLIAEDHPIGVNWIEEQELDARPELVRTMSVQPPRGEGRVRVLDIDGVDLQPCGGTHVRRTGEIGPVRVAKIEKKGRHNRRVSVVFDE